jgi:histone arginine demethylase JMJD6
MVLILEDRGIGMKFEIERRANVTYAEFAQKYLFGNKPVVITDAIHRWKALSRWTPEFFKTEFGDMRFTIDDNKKGKAEYKGNGTVEFTMARFLDRVLASTDEDPAPYFRNRILDDTFPTLKQDVEPLPDHLFPNWLPESYLMKSIERLFNRGAKMEIYIGGQGGVFPVLHYDGLASHAFLMQIYGRKKFILYAPENEPYMYRKPGQINVSRIRDIERPDSKQFPLFAKAEPATFILEPGETLFIPGRWWHTTKMLTPSISISVNTVNGSNWRDLTDFVCGTQRRFLRTPMRLYLNFAGAWRSQRDQRRQLTRPSQPDGK